MRMPVSGWMHPALDIDRPDVGRQRFPSAYRSSTAGGPVIVVPEGEATAEMMQYGRSIKGWVVLSESLWDALCRQA